MQLDVYIIRGRGGDGSKFQLAMVRNAEGHYYKGEYDPTLQFSSLSEVKQMLAPVVGADAADIQLNELRL